ncbi:MULTISPECIES: DUF6161 domain-containing protein [Deefgea]|uniref:DUF6161 domain-containing protein n=1 Tax=Deefgea chitinilytica TaxID=570276 RepID=A0ABS2CD78_9NEIS|nr:MULTISPECIES: DUF6161 domain-containing protein [Deefgea]MBM5572098.1 hypothetical protein [Deefgea chitinilytica]MBM9889333.1 hypothetical protein [Deefgea sp. CFH1-16]
MNDRRISVQIIDIAGYVARFDSYQAFRSFIEAETTFWEVAQQRLGDRAINQAYVNIGPTLRHFLNQVDANLPSWSGLEETAFTGQLNWAIQNYFPSSQSTWLWSGQPFVAAYLDCFATYGAPAGQSFIDYVVRNSTGGISNADSFKGYMFGYEFQHQGSEILQRSKSEADSLERLRAQYVDARNELFGETDAVREEIRNWDQQHRAQSNRRLAAQKRLNKAIVHKNEERFASSLTHMHEELNAWQSKVTELENLYQEKLKLQKPAEYWAKAAKRYGLQGGLWALTMVAAIVLGLVYFREFFLTWLQGKQLPLQLNSLQGVVLFGSIAAVYAFLLKTLSRLAFSAFHLMRDAEEREQLTYLYLALSNESAVDEKSREIVLQALFSRSETGLLANENGPTMPGIEMLKAATGKG